MTVFDKEIYAQRFLHSISMLEKCFSDAIFPEDMAIVETWFEVDKTALQRYLKSCYFWKSNTKEMCQQDLLCSIENYRSEIRINQK